MFAAPDLILLSRRKFLHDLACVGSAIGLTQLLSRDGLLGAEGPAPYRPVIDPAQPYAPRPPQFRARAEQLLVIFCAGAVSHVDSWDYKPELIRQDGCTPPNAPAVTFMGPVGKLAKPRWEFKPSGQCGKMISQLFPKLAELADDICF